jgi:hypothetical protein
MGFAAIGRSGEAYRGDCREKQGEEGVSHEEIIIDAVCGIELAFKTMLFSDLRNRNKREAE